MEIPTEADHEWVRHCIGRKPRSDYRVAVRDDKGLPAVIRNPPFLDDGTPMPTTFWLTDPELSRFAGMLESHGGVRDSEASVDPEKLRHSHESYKAQRDAVIPPSWDGPRPSGGVGGTRQGVKCLHTHLAWYLAGGEDPIGEWAVQQLCDFDSIDSSAKKWLAKQRWIRDRVSSELAAQISELDS